MHLQNHNYCYNYDESRWKNSLTLIHFGIRNINFIQSNQRPSLRSTKGLRQVFLFKSKRVNNVNLRVDYYRQSVRKQFPYFILKIKALQGCFLKSNESTDTIFVSHIFFFSFNTHANFSLQVQVSFCFFFFNDLPSSIFFVSGHTFFLSIA